MLSFEPLHGFVDKMVFEIVEGQPGRGVCRPSGGWGGWSLLLFPRNSALTYITLSLVK